LLAFLIISGAKRGSEMENENSYRSHLAPGWWILPLFALEAFVLWRVLDFLWMLHKLGQ
jgi:hypothetical protein